MTVLKLFHLTFIYTSSLIIKEKKREGQSFKTALNHVQILKKIIIMKRKRREILRKEGKKKGFTYH